jgi:hypothetical protein
MRGNIRGRSLRGAPYGDLTCPAVLTGRDLPDDRDGYSRTIMLSRSRG